MSLLPFLNRVVSRVDLSADEAQQAMNILLQGSAGSSEIAAFLVALRMKGETAEELAGLARAMRENMIAVDVDSDVVDNCGTGGDASGTFNISTTASFVVAGAGARVAKHGNRSISSATGAADVLEALGVSVTSTAEEAARQIREIGIAFLFAPAFHPAMKHVQPVRRELKLRTVFNLLGPLANPARASRQVIGVASTEAAKLVAEAVALLGSQRVFIVHGHGGLDEISITGPTEVYEIVGSTVTHQTWTPEDFGMSSVDLNALAGGNTEHNASIATAILTGHATEPQRNVVLANAAAGLVVAGLAPDLRSGVALAATSIDSGAALAKLDLLRQAAPVR
jgi:anthranilate phosphoribosyltransferase